METPASAPRSAARKSGCGGALLWPAGLVFVFGIGLWFFEGHDLMTKWYFHKTRHYQQAQWKQIYDDARVIYQKHAEELKTKDRISLSPSEMPPMIRELGMDEFFVTPEGVTYERAGGGVDIYFMAIHCVFEPQSRAYDRKGIWFLGPNKRDWMYVEH
jgi:hypothetical protein